MRLTVTLTCRSRLSGFETVGFPLDARTIATAVPASELAVWPGSSGYRALGPGRSPLTRSGLAAPLSSPVSGHVFVVRAWVGGAPCEHAFRPRHRRRGARATDTPAAEAVPFEGGTWEFTEPHTCDPEEDLVRASFGREPDEDGGNRFSVHAQRSLEGEPGSDDCLGFDEVSVEQPFDPDETDRQNEQGWVRWEQEEDGELSFTRGDGEVPVLRATEDGQMTAQGELVVLLGDEGLYSGEFHMALSCR